MARSIHKLSSVGLQSRQLKAGKHADGGGLYLNVTASGSKSWLFIWTGERRRREMGLGPYPAVSLASARKKAAELREAVAEGRDPLQEKQKSKEPVFADCAAMFLESMEGQWRNEKHRAQWRMTLDVYCAPIEQMRVSQIDTDDVLRVLTPIWQTKNETASRLRGRIERVLDYARVRGWRSGENPALWRGHLKSILPARQKLQRGHHPAMPYEQVPAFYERLHQHEAIAARALQFLILTASRSGEVLNACWGEFDLDKKLWVIPADRMKAGRIHRVPLSEQANSILQQMLETQISNYVFPGQRPGRPLSEMAMLMLLRRMKLDQYTVHGFRSSFRDWAGEETSFAREAAEAALAHTIGDATERAYRRGDALEKRRQLMEAWATYARSVPQGNVIPFSSSLYNAWDFGLTVSVASF